MSGVNRAIQAELVAKGASGAEVVAAYQPDAILEETGRAKSQGGDADSYVGKDAKPAN